ncbi:sugar transferase [Candidatus Kaiserbacteria bacterium]|nr:sugar transferase [Candidatus Kaiserbacteria bacterium]
MTFVPKREYLVLLAGDLAIFALSLWLTLAIRNLSIPSTYLIKLNFPPFLILFVVWLGVFFLAGLYGKHTRLFRNRLFNTIISTQILNVVIAALAFFFISAFGITPKTILAIYLAVSSVLIVIWRAVVFPRIRVARNLHGVLIASGPDAKALADEVNADSRYPVTFDYVIDTKEAKSHEIVQQACRVVEEDGLAVLVVDFADPSLNVALPIVYDAAFQKRRFALVDVNDLHQEVFDRVPLSFVTYEWVLGNLARSRAYDGLKRFIDIVLGIIAGALSLVFYPFVMLAIKLDDGGDIFITQHRVGRYQKPIHVIKFRSMSGSDSGDDVLKSKHKVTRVGRVLRRLRLDELPQLWNVIKGDLSFVGPRPELPALAAHYSARIPYYNARYLVTPGLTGWAQIKHDRHPHHGTDVAETKEKLAYDLFYFRRRSLLLDIYIILQTARIIFSAKGS